MKDDRSDVPPENAKPTEWIEIVEPKSKQRMFANLVTGECAWEPPPNVYVKKTEGNQWWELYDSNNTCRYYYYNPTTTETVWQRPFNCDIIPLAKLQLLKENTECSVSSTTSKVQHPVNNCCPHCIPRPDDYHHHYHQHYSHQQGHYPGGDYTKFCADVGAALPGLTPGGHQHPAGHSPHHQCLSFADNHSSASSSVAMAAFNDSFSENGVGDSDPDGRGTSRNRDKQRNPSASFTYRRVQTSRSRPNPKNSSTISELPTQIAAGHRNWAFAKGFRSYSPSSSVSSFGNHSTDLLSTESTAPAADAAFVGRPKSERGSASDGTAAPHEQQSQPPSKASASALAASAAAVGRRRCELRDASVSSASSTAAPRTPYVSTANAQPDTLSNSASMGGGAVGSSSVDGGSIAAGAESWTKNSLKAPLNAELVDKKLRKHALSLFKNIQSYMGDRKSKSSADQIALVIVEYCVTASADSSYADVAALIDEVFLQLLKQLIDNPKGDSIRRGWELLGIFLFFFAPSARIFRQVLNFVEFYSDPILDSPELGASKYAKHCMKRLQMSKPFTTANGSTINVAITPARPSTIEAIRQARYNIFYPSKFGTTLEELMEMQVSQFPHLKIPWIQATLIRMIIESGGEKTEGIFRIASDPEQLNTALMQLEVWVKPVVKDAHVPAALLKQWLRQLPSPLIPADMYEACLMAATSAPKTVADACCRLIGALPDINRVVLAALAQLLQRLCRNPDTVRHTKMDVANLAMVMAPNVLRCESDDPAVIFANSRREMEFMKAVILHYDTSAYGADALGG